MSNARAIFERYVNGGVREIEQAIDPPAQEENLYLDFKQAADGHALLLRQLGWRCDCLGCCGLFCSQR
jgi:hypothetical protein